MQNRQVVVEKLPNEKLLCDNFKVRMGSMPKLSSGQVLVRTIAFAITAGARAGLQGSASYAGVAKTDVVMRGTGVGEVIASTNAHIPVGSKVLGPTGWQEYAALNTELLTLIPESCDPLKYIGPLGINGLAAYFGLLKAGRPIIGETVLVSSAAGSVGHFVGQMAKIIGCKVVGVTGGDSKGERLINELGFDAAVNYKSANFRKDLKLATPNGVDVYFDNTGGNILGSALFRLNVGGRIACCGVVSQYDTSSPDPGPRGIPGLLVNKRITMQGFLVFDYANEYQTARDEINKWVDSGKLFCWTDEVIGLDSAPEAFVDLLAGGNMGSRIVRLDRA
ncbi:MAG: NADP-dependent oxidoreductase [Porticoccaceae bacterium]|nr:NADP-dependent oxidoreductase [Porticoccaceae bacterium]|tara:strand:- start:1080 stop:2084 length:1005 start_codon:yes stop_codon:yes gene_type:complete